MPTKMRTDNAQVLPSPLRSTPERTVREPWIPAQWIRVEWLILPALAFLLVFYAYPLFKLFLVSIDAPSFSARHYIRFAQDSVYLRVLVRTFAVSAFVTVSCLGLGFPVAYYMARVASRRTRNLLVVGILLPLWASYLVKVYAWRVILAEDGILNWALAPLGLKGPGVGDVATWLVFSYLWLPYMILPISTGLERIPSSLLEASGDLGARSWMTFRRVILPLVFPAIVAGSIFTFSLTMGDYIAPQLGSSTQLIGDVIYANVGSSGDLPFAAAFATVPVVVMIVYLLLARRLGAFDAL